MARYADAVEWIADNDDTDLGDPEENNYIISVCLIADVFNKDRKTVYEDVMHRRRIDGRQQRKKED